MEPMNLALAAGGFVLGLLLALPIFSVSLKRIKRKAQDEAAGLLENARSEAESLKAGTLVEAREQWEEERETLESKIKKKVDNLRSFEKKLMSKQQSLRDKERNAKDREKQANQASKEALATHEEALAKQEKLDSLTMEVNEKLATIAGTSVEDAHRQLMENLKVEAQNDAAHLIRDIKRDAIKRAEADALNIITLAVERVAVDQVVERTTSVIKLPDPAIKGRIIGQEGKNIRAFEEATGMQLLVNEIPDAVVVSGFNPIKREVARMVMDKLVKGGAIHPRKINELVKKSQKKVNGICRRAAEDALDYLGIKKVHPEIVKVLGNLRYRTSYGQNVLNHSVEVAELCRGMAMELGLDPKIATRAGLFHDLGKGIDFEREGTHPELGAEIGRKYKEDPIVVNGIESHHEDVPVIHPIASLVAACDAISGARPGARRSSNTDYAKRIETMEGIAKSFDGVDYAYAIQAGRQLRVMVKPALIDDAQVEVLSDSISKKISSEMDFPGKIKVVVIREMRAVEYAS